MTRYVLQAISQLMLCGWLMRKGGFRGLEGRLVTSSVRSTTVPRPTAEILCRAVDTACVLYFNRVLCLQRSAATTLLLRSYGFHAHLVIGAQIVPFQSHAWVEIDYCVVNDKPYVAEIYRELQRC
jgi:hypothetical protein